MADRTPSIASFAEKSSSTNGIFTQSNSFNHISWMIAAALRVIFTKKKIDWRICKQATWMCMSHKWTRSHWLVRAPLTFARLPLLLLLLPCLIGLQTPLDFSFPSLIVPIGFPEPMSNFCLPAAGDHAVMQKEPMGDSLDESMASAVKNKFVIPAIS